MYYGESIGANLVKILGGFVFTVMIVIAVIVVAANGGISRTMITGVITEIEQNATFQGEVVLTVADAHHSVAADGSERVMTYNRAVFFKNAEDIEGIEIGDTVTVSGKLNGYSLFDGRVES